MRRLADFDSANRAGRSDGVRDCRGKKSWTRSYIQNLFAPSGCQYLDKRLALRDNIGSGVNREESFRCVFVVSQSDHAHVLPEIILTLARIFHPATQIEVGGIAQSPFDTGVGQIDSRDSSDAKLYRE